MTVRILYFANLRESIGCGSEEIELPAGVATVGKLRELLGQRHEALLTAKNLRCAVNQKMCGLDASVGEGAEVAFFPPVTGG